ncbi:acyl-CoA dehydrogenase family protein [Spongiactinospora sp. 9N601]|uniref:acyl-CoA dehydrogenase family protein n=1 Tax=Spongiactinospora sp. 9N601 TaxID=3375149 RepID=UPI00379D2896
MLRELYLGRVRWDLLLPFPEQDQADLRAGDEALARLRRLLAEHVDPAAVERDGRLPEGFLAALQDAGLLRLMIDPALGGLGLSWLNACRVVEAAADWSTPVAFTLAIHNGFGSGVYLQALPPGPLRDLISGRVAAGLVSGTADAEVAGAGNRGRTTVAVPVEGGAAYLISGEKVFIGNGPVAELVDVSATVTDADGGEEVRLFFVDTASPGFEVAGTHEFMGLRGAAFGRLRLDRVRVPAEHMMPETSGAWRMQPTTTGDRADAQTATADLGLLALFGRHLLIAPVSLAVARASLLWARDFVGRRTINERPLGEYEEIRRRVAENAAEVFHIESLLTWCLLGAGRADTCPDLTAAKNLMALAAWRAVDGTMALLGAEGYETAGSKAARGAPPLPVERCFRDARGLRVAGGVEFMLDLWSAEANLRPFYEPGGPPAAGPEPVPTPGFPAGLRDHARLVQSHADRLAERCRAMTGELPLAELLTRQRPLALLGRIATELLGACVVLARAAGLARPGETAALDLADVACAASAHRLDQLWSQLAGEAVRHGPGPAALGDAWLRDDGALDFLIGPHDHWSGS